MSYGHARVKNYLINKVNISNINCKVIKLMQKKNWNLYEEQFKKLKSHFIITK